jgi:hypothetical protein
MGNRLRVVIASPHLAECGMLAGWVSAEGFEPVTVTSLSRATDEIKSRPFDLLVSDFTFAARNGLFAESLPRVRTGQTAVIVLGEAAVAPQVEALGRRAMFLPRPADHASFVCLVSMALMDARPVRRSLRKAVSRFDATVDGVPSHILDVSNEGLRLEIPRGKRPAPPPVFSVRVPLVGVSLLVRRMWAATARATQKDAVTLYGSALSQNPPRVEQAWRAFVDALPVGGGAWSPMVELQ